MRRTLSGLGLLAGLTLGVAVPGADAQTPPSAPAPATPAAQAAPSQAPAAAPAPRPQPPTRDPRTPGYVPATELPDGTPQPANADGNFIVGPTHSPAPETIVQPGVPQGTVYEFTMSSADSKIYPGIARDAGTFGTPDPDNPAKLNVTTSGPRPYTRNVGVSWENMTPMFNAAEDYIRMWERTCTLADTKATLDGNPEAGCHPTWIDFEGGFDP